MAGDASRPSQPHAAEEHESVEAATARELLASMTAKTEDRPSSAPPVRPRPRPTPLPPVPMFPPPPKPLQTLPTTRPPAPDAPGAPPIAAPAFPPEMFVPGQQRGSASAVAAGEPQRRQTEGLPIFAAAHEEAWRTRTSERLLDVLALREHLLLRQLHMRHNRQSSTTMASGVSVVSSATGIVFYVGWFVVCLSRCSA